MASKVWPEATRKITELCLAGKTNDLEFWPACSDTLFLASNPIPVKWLHHQRGEISTAVTRAPLDVRDLKETEAVLNADGQVEAWMKMTSSL